MMPLQIHRMPANDNRLKRKDFQRLAQMRAGDAEVLLASKRYPAAYHLAGLAIECALKSCIAGKTKRYEFHDLGLARKSHIHDLQELAKVAGLAESLAKEQASNKEF